MPVTDTLAEAVRQQLSLGRLLPLGDAADAAWITERAAVAGLLGSLEDLAGVRATELQIAPAETAAPASPAVPLPPSALPPGALQLTGSLAASGAEPFPAAAERLRARLLKTADERLGLRVDTVDLTVVELLEDPAAPSARGANSPLQEGSSHADGEAGRPSVDARVDADGGAEQLAEKVAAAVHRVPGVADTSSRLDSTLRRLGLRDAEVDVTPASGGAPEHLLVQIATSTGHRALTVARAARAAALNTAAARGSSATVAVLVVATDAPEPKKR